MDIRMEEATEAFLVAHPGSTHDAIVDHVAEKTGACRKSIANRLNSLKRMRLVKLKTQVGHYKKWTYIWNGDENRSIVPACKAPRVQGKALSPMAWMVAHSGEAK
jgi:hypothetical protein